MKTPSVFGFQGIYRLLARTVGVDIDTVIGLPANLFYSTGTPASLEGAERVRRRREDKGK